MNKRVTSWCAIVLIIAGGIASGVYFWASHLSRMAEIHQAQDDLEKLETLVRHYEIRQGYPPTDLQKVIDSHNDCCNPLFVPPPNLADPWGQLYVYEPQPRQKSVGTPFLVYSKGPPGENKRISNVPTK